MLVDRQKLLSVLQIVELGTGRSKILAQAGVFVFRGGTVTSFNDEVSVRAPVPFLIDAVVPAETLLKVLSRFPDEQVEVRLESGELLLEGKKRQAGVTCVEEIELVEDIVPAEGEASWYELSSSTNENIQQAARSCGTDETKSLTTCVHVTPEYVEASDGQRLFRATAPTGFAEEVLLPASNVEVLSKLKLSLVSLTESWCHFTLDSEDVIVVSIRCSREPYFPKDKLDSLLSSREGVQIRFPANFEEIIERACSMCESGYDGRVGIVLEEGSLDISARKADGWYKEKKRVQYKGERIAFEVNPVFLLHMLQRTREVLVEPTEFRMRMFGEGESFVVCLQVMN